jgi:hypothetical protein
MESMHPPEHPTTTTTTTTAAQVSDLKKRTVNKDVSKDRRIFNFTVKQSGNSKDGGTTILPIRQSTPCTVPYQRSSTFNNSVAGSSNIKQDSDQNFVDIWSLKGRARRYRQCDSCACCRAEARRHHRAHII